MNTVAKNISRLALIAITAISLVSTVNALPTTKTGTDYQMTRVSGKSMLPTLKSGETAVVYKAYPFKKLRVGDVVIIESTKGYNVIHRIVRRYRGGTWVTQGDNNKHEDREVLTHKNFGGLALVDESVVRYQKYLASIGGEKKEAEKTLVAMADTTNANRLDRLRNL